MLTLHVLFWGISELISRARLEFIIVIAQRMRGNLIWNVFKSNAISMDEDDDMDDISRKIIK